VVVVVMDEIVKCMHITKDVQDVIVKASSHRVSMKNVINVATIFNATNILQIVIVVNEQIYNVKLFRVVGIVVRVHTVNTILLAVMN
jgi:hypothetical protein